MTKVCFFGRLADHFGRETRLELPSGTSIADLRRIIAATRPDLDQILTRARVRACIGNSMVPEDYVVQMDDVVEFLPPVSGG